MKPKIVLHGLLLCASVMVQSPSHANPEPFPSKPIRVVVPFAAGGGVDVIARMVGDKLNTTWGQPVVVENKPGAGTLIGARAVAISPPDGYTLLAATADTLAVAAALRTDPITLPEKTLTPLTQIVRTPLFIIVRVDSPYRTLADFVDAARKHPGGLSYASAGIGTIHHMAMELFDAQAKIEVKHVAYRGSSPALADLLAGVVDVAMIDSPVALPQLEGGKVRALAVSTATRAAVSPNVPTIAEQGYPGFDAVSWMGFAVPRGTPAPVIEQLHAGIRDAINNPEVAQRLRGMGLEPVTSKTPADFERFADGERARWTEVIREKNIHLD